MVVANIIPKHIKCKLSNQHRWHRYYILWKNGLVTLFIVNDICI